MKSQYIGSRYRSKNLFRLMETSAVKVRKQLAKGAWDREFRGVVKDAMQIADMIENLSIYGQVCEAEELDDLEILVQHLDAKLNEKIDQVFAFQIQ